MAASTGHRVVVTFPGAGQLVSIYDPSRPLAEFRDQLERSFFAGFRCQVEVSGFLDRDFKPVEVPVAHDELVEGSTVLPRIVAKFCARNASSSNSMSTSSVTSSENTPAATPRKRRFDKRPERLAAAAGRTMSVKESLQSSDASEDNRELFCVREEEEEAEEEEKDGRVLERVPEEQVSLEGGRFFSKWRQRRSAGQAKAAAARDDAGHLPRYQEDLEFGLESPPQEEVPSSARGFQSMSGTRESEVPSSARGFQSVSGTRQSEVPSSVRSFDSFEAMEEVGWNDDDAWEEDQFEEEEDWEDEDQEELPGDVYDGFLSACAEEEAAAWQEEEHVPRLFRRRPRSPAPVVYEVPVVNLEMPEEVPDSDEWSDLSFSDDEPQAAPPPEVRKGGKGNGKGKGKTKSKAPPPFEPPTAPIKDREVELPAMPVPSIQTEVNVRSIRMQHLIKRQIHRQVEHKKARYRKEVERILAKLGSVGYNEDDAFELLEHKDFDAERAEEYADLILKEKDKVLKKLLPQSYSEDYVHSLFVQCSFDLDMIDRRVRMLEKKQADAAPQVDEWTSVLSRKRQEDMNKEGLGELELQYLECNFAGLLKALYDDRSSSDGDDLEDAQDGQPGVWKKVRRKPRQVKEKKERNYVQRQREQKVAYATKPQDKIEELKQQWEQRQQALEKQAPEEDILPDKGPEETTINMLTNHECRNLLLRMKPLTRPPAYLHRVLGKRAVREYIKFKPKNFYDCQDVTFWQFTMRSERECTAATFRARQGFAGKPFFDVLNFSDIFVKAIPQMHPIAVVYMLYTMQQSGNAFREVFRKAGRYVAEHISKLDRDSLGKLAFVFAAAHINEPGIFHVVAQDVNRRAAMREGEHSLSPRVLQDLFFSFGRARVYQKDCIENLMLRCVSLFDADVTRSAIDPEFCAPTMSKTGFWVYAQPFKMQGLITILRGLSEMKLLDKEFFDDIAEFTIHCLDQDVDVVDRFMGDAASNMAQMEKLYVKAEMMSSESVRELFAMINAKRYEKGATASRVTEKDLRKSLKQEKKTQEKERQFQQLLHRYKSGARPQEGKQRRCDRARDTRERLACMTADEEARALAAVQASHVSANVLFSGFKTEALLGPAEPPREGKRRTRGGVGAVKEASHRVHNRSMMSKH